LADVAHQEQSLKQEVNTWYFKKTSLEELVDGVKPLASINDLTLDDLTPEEAHSFLHAIEA